MQEIVPGIYLITRAATNCFVIESAPGELTIIDTGFPGTENTILKAAASRNYSAEQIKHILITHADLDHVGGLAKLVNATGAKVYAGKPSLPYLKAGKAPPHVPSLMSGMMNSFQQPANVDLPLDDNQMLDIAGGIRAIHVPGHTPDNFNFFHEKSGMLFAADLFLTITGSVILSPGMISWDKSALPASAKKALNLAPKYICPGHGLPVNLVQSPEKIAALRRQLEGRPGLLAT